LLRLARNALKKAGASPVMAEAAAKHLVHAEEHGLPTHVERVETVITTMLADEGVRLPGSRRFASEKKLRAEGIEIADDLLAKIEKLASA